MYSYNGAPKASAIQPRSLEDEWMGVLDDDLFGKSTEKVKMTRSQKRENNCRREQLQMTAEEEGGSDTDSGTPHLREMSWILAGEGCKIEGDLGGSAGFHMVTVVKMVKKWPLSSWSCQGGARRWS